VPAPSAVLELDAQYRGLREECGLLDRSDRGQLTVSGPDAAAYLQSQLTNEVEALEPGGGCYAALLDRKGHVQADLRLLRIGADELWLDAEAAATEPLRRHLDTYKIGREVEIEDSSGLRAITSLLGPRAVELAGVGTPPGEGAHRSGERDGIELTAVRTDLGIDLISPAKSAGELRRRLVASGAVEVDPGAAEILRVESGRPRFGFELGPEVMPAEAGIVERAVDFEKGCYIGQEPVARLHYRGRPNRRLVGLRLSEAADRGAQLRLGERTVGAIGTSCVSPALGPIALAIVRREASIGDRLSLEGGQGTAEVVELPFR
jgi:folate-binding protein YgfZ